MSLFILPFLSLFSFIHSLISERTYRSRYIIALLTMAVAVFSPWWARPHGNWIDNTCEWGATWDGIYIIFRRTAWGAAVACLLRL